jgi:type I restriction enzyme M protein
LGLVEAEKVKHIEPEAILESVAKKEAKVFAFVREMRDLLARGDTNGE